MFEYLRFYRGDGKTNDSEIHGVTF